jgi:DDE_Tnp_1-associated
LSRSEALASVPDPRDPRGLIHPLPAALALTAAAALAGMRGPGAIAQFGRDRGAALAHAPGFRRGKAPAKSTLSEIYRALDAEALEAAGGRWLRGRAAAAGWGAAAVDGKSLRGSADGEAPAAHLLSAYAPAAAAVLAQLRVEATTNEHKAALRLLGVLPLAGRVVTGDATFAPRDVATAGRGAGGDYALTVKGNQPELRAQIAAALDGDADFPPLPAAAEGGAGAGGAARR